ncbi:hypothetical protein [Piscinibacter sp.]|uniref:hypothetical protein n=1 Tax=Piscinibacter sp. TaxID=1903157 RepID=UPI002BDAD86B|nr:hypothetical protein [Albitalea sp.]HUG25282.1 hypothetical protein [Albitalea sp.]
MEFYMRRVAAAFAVLAIAGCATSPPPSGPGNVVRAQAPANYQSTIHNYFDFTVPNSGGRRLAFGDPELSDCALSGGGGRYRGWVVPVLFDTSKDVKPAPAGRAGRNDAAAAAPVVPSDPQTVSLAEVSITANKYFFWFGSDAIAAVTRRKEACP